MLPLRYDLPYNSVAYRVTYAPIDHMDIVHRPAVASAIHGSEACLGHRDLLTQRVPVLFQLLIGIQ